jgi:hypothetical protein
VYVCLNDWDETTASNGDLNVIVHTDSGKTLTVDFRCTTKFQRASEGTLEESRDFGAVTLTPEDPTAFSIILPQLSRADRSNWKTFSRDACEWKVTENEEQPKQSNCRYGWELDGSCAENPLQ